MSAQAPETVRVKATHPSQGAWVVINRADYDPGKHVLHTDPAESAESAQPAPPAKPRSKRHAP